MTAEPRTARLRLPLLTIQDAADIAAGGHGAHWADGYPTDGDREVAALMLAGAAAAEVGSDSLGPRAMVDRETGMVIGGIGFVAAPADDGTIALGYGIAEEWRGRGLTSEAAQAMVQFACADPRVRRVVADTDAANLASRRVLEKVGMTLLRQQGGRLLFGFDCDPCDRSAVR